VQFHQCVKLGRFDNDRTISFVPPDGEFELMKYRTTENINLPFRVHAIVNEVGKSRVEYKIMVKSTFNSNLFANNVKVYIPTPPNTAGVKTRILAGKASFKPSDGGIIWKYVSPFPSSTTRGTLSVQFSSISSSSSSSSSFSSSSSPQNQEVPGTAGTIPQRRGRAFLHNCEEGVAPRAHLARLSDSHVPRLRPPGALPQGL